MASQDTLARIRSSSLLLAGSALLSRGLGYGRDLLLNALHGATGMTDVYQASFTLPDMLNYLLAGGALTVSLLPRIADVQARRERGEDAPDVDEVFSLVATTMLLAALVGVLVLELFTEPFVRMTVAGFDERQIAETVRLTRIVLPAQLCFLVGGLVQATLLARQRFGALALTPLLYNGGIIVGGAIGAGFDAIEGFSWGALVGAFFGALVVPLYVARGQLRFRFRLAPLHREVRAFLWTALPLMVGVSLTTVDEWFGKYFASSLEPGSISWLNAARRIMLVPIGLIGTAAGQATGAYVARLYAEGRRDELASVVGGAGAAVAGLALAVTGFFVALPEPIVGLLFEHGRYGLDDTLRTAAALRWLALGIAAWGLQQVYARTFYGIGETWRPMWLTTAITLLAVPLYASLSGTISGLAIAGVVGMWAQAAGLIWMAGRRLAVPPSLVLGGIWRGLVVGGVAGGAALALDRLLPWQATLGMGTWAYLARVASAGALWLAVLVGLGWMIGLPGLRRVLGRLPVLRRLVPRAAVAPGRSEREH
jgi:putative peptidoglycan lipid II flippase